MSETTEQPDQSVPEPYQNPDTVESDGADEDDTKPDTKRR
jgi:hypothetical protein